MYRQICVYIMGSINMEMEEKYEKIVVHNQKLYNITVAKCSSNYRK